MGAWAPDPATLGTLRPPVPTLTAQLVEAREEAERQRLIAQGWAVELAEARQALHAACFLLHQMGAEAAGKAYYQQGGLAPSHPQEEQVP